MVGEVLNVIPGDGYKVTLTGGLVAGARQPETLTVQVTWSPLFNVVLVKLVLFVPAFFPFTCHW